MVYDSTPVKRSLGQPCPGVIKTGKIPLDLRFWQSEWGPACNVSTQFKSCKSASNPDLNNTSAETPKAAGGSQQPTAGGPALVFVEQDHTQFLTCGLQPLSWDKAELRSCDRDVWPRNPKIFTIWRFTGSVCQALSQVTFAFGTAVPLELGLTWVLVGRTVRDLGGRQWLRHVLPHLSHVPATFPPRVTHSGRCDSSSAVTVHLT